MASPKSSTRPTQQNPEPNFHDFFPAMAGKLGGEGLIGELCNGFELLMDGDKVLLRSRAFAGTQRRCCDIRLESTKLIFTR
ncbi:unnamed protein product [Arabis nemorensis]|uniref:Uncharacterized protein n=1 Tax=Arabis nemorensis TaxID=586526 RepID=A0A565C282_9BRAS|nr:unnamed protein product [Arabis nemorensis]